MPSDDLAARLRALRRSDAAAKVAKPAHIATPQPDFASTGVRSKVVKRDDVDELIARTRDEVDVAREQVELLDEALADVFPLSIRAACSSCAEGWPIAVVQEHFETGFLVQPAGLNVENDDAGFYTTRI